LVTRKHYPEIPPRVEYSSTKLASSLEPIFQSIDAWGKKNMAAIHKSRDRYDKQTK
jgi:DNA-binding HxlR family transcriptional regulator